LFKLNKIQVLKVSLLVVVAASLSGCLVVFTNSPAGKPKEDKALLGRWASEEKDKEKMTVQFEKGLRGEVKVSFLPAVPGDKNPVFTAKLFAIGAHSYMALNPTDEEDHDKGFVIARYAIRDGELSVWLLNSTKVTDLIKQKKISGEGQQTGATVTESADSVSRFLQSRGADEAFEDFGKFRRAGS
jgi:hypothetical protein